MGLIFYKKVNSDVKAERKYNVGIYALRLINFG